jgi:DNA modification methylase
MKPYYQDDWVTIYHGDCREILPTLPKVDLVLTDPPYGIGADKNLRANKQHGKAVAPSRDYGTGNWDNCPPSEWVFGLILDRCNEAIIWGGNYFNLSPSSCWLVWDKDNGDNGYADCELAWTNLKKAVRKIRYRWAGMLQENMKDKELREHPTQKPVPVMNWAITHASEPQAILDPFMGSGTTLRAAKDLNRKAIGIEIEEKYCEIAAKRMSQEVLNLTK